MYEPNQAVLLVVPPRLNPSNPPPPCIPRTPQTVSFQPDVAPIPTPTYVGPTCLVRSRK